MKLLSLLLLCFSCFAQTSGVLATLELNGDEKTSGRGLVLKSYLQATQENPGFLKQINRQRQAELLKEGKAKLADPNKDSVMPLSYRRSGNTLVQVYLLGFPIVNELGGEVHTFLRVKVTNILEQENSENPVIKKIKIEFMDFSEIR